MDTLIAIGKPAPDFTLRDLKGQMHRLSDYLGKILLLNFWSAECPWVERVDRELLSKLSQWQGKVLLIAVAPNTNEPLEYLQRRAAERGLELVLIDREQKVADLYQVQVTPHCFVIDEHGILRYQGAYDDVTFRQRTPNRVYVCEAIEALVAGKDPEVTQAPAYGCAVVRGT